MVAAARLPAHCEVLPITRIMFHFRCELEAAQAVRRVVLMHVLARHSMIFSESGLIRDPFSTETMFKLCSIEPRSRAVPAGGEPRAARLAEWRGELGLLAVGAGWSAAAPGGPRCRNGVSIANCWVVHPTGQRFRPFPAEWHLTWDNLK